MESLFRLTPTVSSGSIELRQWNYIQNGLRNNVTKIKEFYQAYPIPTNSSHLLARLIHSINISRNLSFDRYLAHCHVSTLPVAQTLKLTSVSSKGQLWDGVFYGNNTKEIIIAHTEHFSINDAYSDWKQLSPVTVLHHNQSNTALLLPDGKLNSIEKGVAVIAINVPMLMAMYYRFNQEQDAVEQGGGARRTIYQFLGGYVLPGMLDTHLDYAIFNRLYNRLQGVPNAEAIRRHSFFLTDYDDALDSSAIQQLEYLKNNKQRFPSVMKAIHLPMNNNLWELSHLPTHHYTLQVYWALTLSRMKMLAFLCLVQKDVEVINSKELTNIRKLMRMYQTRNVIKNNLGLESYFDIATWLDITGIE